MFSSPLCKKIQHSLSPLWVGQCVLILDVQSKRWTKIGQSVLILDVQSKRWTKIGVIGSTGKHGDYNYPHHHGNVLISPTALKLSSYLVLALT